MNISNIIDSDIVAVMLLVVTLCYSRTVLDSSEKTIKVLNLLGIIVIVAAVNESILQYYLAVVKHIDGFVKFMTYTSTIVSATALLGVISFWVDFVYRYVKKENKRGKCFLQILGVISLMWGIAIISSPYTKLAFDITFKENVGIEYKTGKLIIVFLAVAVCYLVHGVIMMISNRRTLSLKDIVIMSITEILIVCGAIGQVFIINWLMIYILAASGIVLVYVCFQDSIEKYDIETGALKRNVFELYVTENLKEEKYNYALAYIYLDDYEDIYSKFGEETSKKYVVDFCKAILQHKNPIFELVQLNMGQFAVYFRTNDIKLINKILADIQTDVDNFNEKNNSEEKYNIKYTYELMLYDPELKGNDELIEQLYCKLYEKEYINKKEIEHA